MNSDPQYLIDQILDLIKRTKYGFISFTDLIVLMTEHPSESFNGIIYDDKSPIEDGYAIVSEYEIANGQGIIISTYTERFKDLTIKAITTEEPYIFITDPMDTESYIYIENGDWTSNTLIRGLS